MLTIDLADELLMTVHPPTARRVCDLRASYMIEDWHQRRAFYTEQVDRANNARLSAWWARCLRMIDAAIADPEGVKPETNRIIMEQDAAFKALDADEIALWNEAMAWHLETNVDRDQWVEAAHLARQTRQDEETP